MHAPSNLGNLLRMGDVTCGSSGDFGPAPLTAMDAKTGNAVWRDRTFSKCSSADGKLIAVDEDGNLSPAGMNVLSRASLLHSNAWTAPALADETLYVRDRQSMMALDLR